MNEKSNNYFYDQYQEQADFHLKDRKVQALDQNQYNSVITNAF